MERTLVVLLVLLAVTSASADNPPPFGTVIQEWPLPMGGAYAGAGITWRRDSARFYLMAQGGQVWSVDALNPSGSTRLERWVLPNMGSPTTDIPWSIAWDNDSSCYWISDIVDGDIYAGCYYTRIRKTAVGDTWRWFSENPGDTWQVGDSSAGGAGNMYWMAGSEKWLDRGCFACAPVAPSPSTNNFVWKFDPYTKTSVGRCAYGSTTSGRGCCLVPWDSNYILTSGVGGLVKRDSTGLLLESVPGGGADMAVWVPQIIGPDDTVFMYQICSDANNTLQKISLGMLWSQLPSVNQRSIELTITAPTGTIDSGQGVYPRVAARNISNEPADDVDVYFSIPDLGYLDSVTGLYFEMRTTETLAFGGVAIIGRDSMDAVAWACWDGDTYTTRSRFFVRVRDIAIPWFSADKDTYEQGEAVTGQGRVENRGNVTQTFDVNTWLADSSTTRSVELVASDSSVVGYGPWQMPPGVYLTGARAIVPNDMVPRNNSALDTFVVRGPIDRDYAVLKILEPTGIKDTLTPVVPSASIKNQGTQSDPAIVFFRITGPGDSIVMDDWAYCQLAPGDSTPVTFPEIRFTRFGRYTSACSVHVAGEQNNLNDKMLDTFYVYPTGIAEATGAPLRYGLSPIPNPCRGPVTVCFNSPFPTPYSVSLYDASGRLVFRSPFAIRQSPFVLDLRSMPTGIYVLRLNAGTFACSEKVVLQR